MLTRKTVLKLGLIVATSTCLVINHHKQVKINRNYQNYVIQEFDKEVKLNKFNFERQFIKPIEENKKKAELEKIQKQQEIERQKQVSLSRGSNIEYEIFTLTFYSSLNCENGYGAITCQGHKLRDGMAANNVLLLGTKIKLQEYGIIEIADRGGSNFNSRNRLDVFVPRNPGESDYKYLKRVNNMGKVKVKGYIIK